MARASAWIMLFLICLNASVTVWSEAGVTEDWGVEPSVGGDNHIEDFNTTAHGLSGNSGQASFLIGLIVSFATLFTGFFEFVFAAPLMLMNLGMVGWIANFIIAPMYAIVVFDGIYMFTGRDV